MTEIIPSLLYNDIPAALACLTSAFGATEEMRHATPGGGMHAPVLLDGHRIMLGGGAASHGMASPAESGTATQGVFVSMADVDAHHARAHEAAARLDHPAPQDHGYGRTFTAWDPEGHPWFFCAASPHT